jgi:hypothetical protein
MKKVILISFFYCLVATAFAQSKFTVATVNDMHQAYIANPVQAVTERTLPTFTMVGSDGKTIDYATFKSWQVAGGLAEWPTSDVTVEQNGNSAIAKGITRHRPKNAKVAFHQRFTETYAFQNGQWMLASAQYTEITGN